MKSISVIGGGIVGLATAYRLRERFPGADVIDRLRHGEISVQEALAELKRSR